MNLDWWLEPRGQLWSVQRVGEFIIPKSMPSLLILSDCSGVHQEKSITQSWGNHIHVRWHVDWTQAKDTWLWEIAPIREYIKKMISWTSELQFFHHSFSHRYVSTVDNLWDGFLYRPQSSSVWKMLTFPLLGLFLWCSLW